MSGSGVVTALRHGTVLDTTIGAAGQHWFTHVNHTSVRMPLILSCHTFFIFQLSNNYYYSIQFQKQIQKKAQQFQNGPRMSLA